MLCWKNHSLEGARCRQVTPSNLRKQILMSLHDDPKVTHFGFLKTYMRGSDGNTFGHSCIHPSVSTFHPAWHVKGAKARLPFRFVFYSLFHRPCTPFNRCVLTSYDFFPSQGLVMGGLSSLLPTLLAILLRLYCHLLVRDSEFLYIAKFCSAMAARSFCPSF